MRTDAQASRSNTSPKRKRGSSSPLRAAFTLTELLVVITIIAVLAGLITVAVLGALDTAKQTRIKAEVDLLDAALKQFKDKYGAYPPFDLTAANATAVKAFVARAFPRYQGRNGGIAGVMQDLDDVLDCNGTAQRPDQALVFWLNGFNPDPSDPFQLRLDTSQPYSVTNRLDKAMRKDVLFDFDVSRLRPVGTHPNGADSYMPPGLKSDIPYLYFDIATLRNPSAPVVPSMAYWSANQHAGLPITAGDAWVYADANDPNMAMFANHDSFQILATGMDEKYGPIFVSATAHMYPTGVGWDLTGTEDDNVTNFCPKARLGDAKP